jgi:N-methylhydantoinase A/oxoprolinase/acetone carboxylase beta subunit/N-methylhydantoinase B/oxoprolinase/acetone carboxylase alpha subunit
VEIGVDIGGTFTDIVALRADGRLTLTKVPSTPANLLEGIGNAVERLLSLTGASPSEVERFVHGTTVATNAILEQKGALTALLTTEGFEDVLELGRQKRSRMYDLFMDPETPTFLAPRRRRIGIRERLDAHGTVLTPLDEDAVRTAVARLRAQGIQAIAVCYLFSFVNPAHERRTREIIHDIAPEITVSLSSEVDPTFREYERTCVTTFDAYLGPVVKHYLVRLGDALRQLGVRSPPLIMRSRGGIVSADLAAEEPVTLFLSGPAGGVIGAKFAAELSGVSDFVSLDMGGTSNDVAVVRGGEPLIAREGFISTYPVRTPMVDVSTIGAGGGSIAWIDAAGGLRVGPQSAGAEPGPACYARGGEAATVTDADLLLGYLNPERFAGGLMTLDVDAAERALNALGTRLGLDAIATAAGIHRVVNARMADQIRLVTIKRGYDPRTFSLLVLGGAGPVHGVALAEEMEMSEVIVPATPGVLAAFGLLSASIEHHHARTLQCRTDAVDFAAVNDCLAKLDALGRSRMRDENVPESAVRVAYSADMRYLGQAYELEVPLERPLAPGRMPAVLAAFHAVHERVYGYARTGQPVEFVNLRAVHSCPFPRAEVRADAPTGGSVEEARMGDRHTWFPASGFVATAVYDRVRLPIGGRVTGPAIIEQVDTTTVLPPGHAATVDDAGNLRLRRIPTVEAEKRTAVRAVPTGRTDSAGTATNDAPRFTVDPILLEVLRNRLDTIADEMELTLLKSAASPIVKEGLDASAALFNIYGETVAQAAAIPIHLGALQFAAQRIVRAFAPERMKEGDAFILNDPYDGGTHLPDITLAVPVFADGRAVSLACTMCHHQDVGGRTPGSVPTDATELYQEGVIIPPTQLFRAGVLDENLFALLSRNVRLPEVFAGDLMAQVAAGRLGGQRLREMFKAHGTDTVLAYVEELLSQAERLTRAQIETIPDGDYAFEDYLDDDGVDLGRRVKFAVTVRVRGSSMTFDFAGTDPQVRGPFNSVPASTMSAVYYAVRAISDASIPNNGGCFRAVDAVLPEGTIVNPRPPSPVSCRTATIKRIADTLLGALVKALPGKLPAANSGTLLVMSFGGVDPVTGKPFVASELAAGGMGARPGKDGIDCIETDVSNCMNIPVESVEMNFPLRIPRARLWVDSGGAGKWRGGLGLEKVYEATTTDIVVSHRGERFTSAPWGLEGGQPGKSARAFIMRRNGAREELPSKKMIVLHPGDQLWEYVAGGAGFGDPRERDPKLLSDDLQDGKTSRTAS